MDRLDRKLQELFPEIISSLQSSVRIPSVRASAEEGAPFGREVGRALDHALREARRLGLRTGECDGYVGWAEIGDGDEMVAVLAHLDVVPAGDGWSLPPYGAEVREGRLYGRGAMDDKGPAIGALWALHAIRSLALPLRRRIRLILGTNEESGMADIPHYLQAGGESPRFGFTPDGDFPIVAAEKGQLHVDLRGSLPPHRRIGLKKLTAGTARNVVPDEACATLSCPGDAAAAGVADVLNEGASAGGIPLSLRGRGTETLGVSLRGRSAHGSTPERGVNAALLLMDLLGEKIDEDWARRLREVARCFLGDPGGRRLGLAVSDAPSGALTCNVGIVEGGEDSFLMGLDIRHPVTADAEELLDRLGGWARGQSLGMELLRRKPPLWMPPESELIRRLQKVYREKTGQEPSLLSMGGGTYAKALPNTVAFGPRFPGEPDVVHKADEYIALDSFLRTVRIMAAAMVELAS